MPKQPDPPRPDTGLTGAFPAHPTGAGGADTGAVAHRPRPEPDDHLCTCGRIRESCARAEIRAIWSG